MNLQQITIEGRKEGHDYQLWCNGQHLDIAASQRVRNHSQGFCWGYLGSGPAQSALAICLHVFGDRSHAEALYQLFKEAYVATWPIESSFRIELDLTDFVLDHARLLDETATTKS